MGEVSREADRRPQRRSRLPHPCLALEQTTSFKKKVDFFRIFLAVRAPERPPGGAPGGHAWRTSPVRWLPLIAQ